MLSGQKQISILFHCAQLNRKYFYFSKRKHNNSNVEGANQMAMILLTLQGAGWKEGKSTPWGNWLAWSDSQMEWVIYVQCENLLGRDAQG